MSWSRFFDGAAPEEVPPYFAAMVPTEIPPPAASDGGDDVPARLAAAAPEEREELVTEYLVAKVGQILGHPDPSKLDGEATLLELGFDSLMAIQLRNALRSGLGADLPIGRLFDSASVESLAPLVQEALEASPPPSSGEDPDEGKAHVEVI